MATTTKLTLPANVYTSIMGKNKGQPLSTVVGSVMRSALSGEIEIPQRETTFSKATSISTDPELVKAFKAWATDKGLSFNEAVTLLLEKKYSHR